jgi:predicted nucleic acid-binding protein
MSAVELPGLFFLDTNLFVYSFDTTEPEKQRIAQQLIQGALHTRQGLISSQIVQEFLNIALRKFAQPMTASEARVYLQIVLMPLCQHFPSVAFYERALELQVETGYAWYDTLVVTAAVEVGCQTLLSEDLQHRRVVQGVTILNPFSTSLVTR